MSRKCISPRGYQETDTITCWTLVACGNCPRLESIVMKGGWVAAGGAIGSLTIGWQFVFSFRPPYSFPIRLSLMSDTTIAYLKLGTVVSEPKTKQQPKKELGYGESNPELPRA